MTRNPSPSVAGRTRPLVSIVLPVYNEAAILREHTVLLIEYLRSLEDRFRFDIIIVNDGSSDESGAIAARLARDYKSVSVCEHPRNFGVGQALKTGFARCRGDYVVTMDVDFSYGPEHIGLLLDRIVSTNARLVLASPYMKGGRVLEVPWVRQLLSRIANWFLARVSGHRISTMTCMVRAVDGRFLRSLNLRNMGMDMMPEMIQKAAVLRASIEEVPAELNWRLQNHLGARRRSSMRIASHIGDTVASGFIMRPFTFLLVPGLLLLAVAAYVNTWLVIHVAEAYAKLVATTGDGDVTVAVAMAYRAFPHTFVVGLVALMLSLQLNGMAMLSLQNKKYFEELFHLGSAVLRQQRDAQHAAASAADSSQSD